MIFDIINRDSNFWNAKNDTAFPALLRYGYSKYLINTVNGITYTKSDPHNELEEMPSYGETEFIVNKGAGTVYDIMINADTIGTWNTPQQSGYLFQIFSNGNVFYYSINSGALTLLLSSNITIVANTDYQIKRNYDENTFVHTLYIKGGIYEDFIEIPNLETSPIVNSDNPTTKYFTASLDPVDVISHLKNNNEKYDIDNFLTISGEFEKSNILGIDNSYDAKGNELEIPPNAGFSNTGNILDNIQISGIESNATFEDVQAIDNSDTIEITKDENTVSRLIVKQ